MIGRIIFTLGALAVASFGLLVLIGVWDRYEQETAALGFNGVYERYLASQAGFRILEGLPGSRRIQTRKASVGRARGVISESLGDGNCVARYSREGKSGASAAASPASNLQSVQHPGRQAIKPNKQQAIDAAEGQSLRGFAPQDVELMSKHKDFGFQRSPRPEQPDQGAPDQPAKIAHRSNYRPIRGRRSAVLGLR